MCSRSFLCKLVVPILLGSILILQPNYALAKSKGKHHHSKDQHHKDNVAVWRKPSHHHRGYRIYGRPCYGSYYGYSGIVFRPSKNVAISIGGSSRYCGRAACRRRGRCGCMRRGAYRRRRYPRYYGGRRRSSYVVYYRYR